MALKSSLDAFAFALSNEVSCASANLRLDCDRRKKFSCAFSGKLGQCRIGADGELLELVDKNKDCPFE